MSETLLLVTEGSHRGPVEEACNALGIQLDVRGPSQTDNSNHKVWLLDVPLDRAAQLAKARPPGTRCITVASESSAEQAWGLLGTTFDDVVVAPVNQPQLQGRIRAALATPAIDLHQRSRCLRLVAHDINNPLTAIRLLSEMLVADIHDPNMKRDMEDILEASDLAAAIVESVSALARLESTPARSAPASIDLRTLMREASTRPSMRNHVRMELPAHPVVVRGEEPALKNAVFDLVLNARSLTEGRDVFWLSVRLEGDTAVLRARSPSKQIPDDLSVGLHVPYGIVALRDARVHVAATGLAHASATARRMGGELRVSSDERGTTFELRLPAHMQS